MVILKNRAAYVEVKRDGNILFRKNKAQFGGGLGSALMHAFDLQPNEYGVYVIHGLTDAQCDHIKSLNRMDGRRAGDMLDIEVLLGHVKEGSYNIEFIGK